MLPYILSALAILISAGSLWVAVKAYRRDSWDIGVTVCAVFRWPTIQTRGNVTVYKSQSIELYLKVDRDWRAHVARHGDPTKAEVSLRVTAVNNGNTPVTVEGLAVGTRAHSSSPQSPGDLDKFPLRLAPGDNVGWECPVSTLTPETMDRRRRFQGVARLGTGRSISSEWLRLPSDLESPKVTAPAKPGPG